MGKDVFISYSSQDKQIAEELCELLEQRELNCWIAPRDIPAGSEFEVSILNAIDETNAIVVVLSSSSNQSPFVKNEVNRAFSKGKGIFTFRVEDITPTSALEFYLARNQWTDGFTPPIEQPVERMVRSLLAFVQSHKTTMPPRSEPQRDHQDSLSHQLEVEGWNLPLSIADLFCGTLDCADVGRRVLSHNRKTPDLKDSEAPLNELKSLLPDELGHAVNRFIEDYQKLNERIHAEISSEPIADGQLEIVNIGTTTDGELDVMLRNLGDDTVYITRLTIRVLREQGAFGRVLNPSAKYELPTAELNVNQSQSLDVSHIVEPHSADRFTISVQDNRAVFLRLTLQYDKRYSVSENVWLNGPVKM